MQNKKIEGNKAENAAVQFLRERGYAVLSRNRRIGGVEVDIIATIAAVNTELQDNIDKNYFFIEVKKTTQSNYSAGFPVLTNRQKQRYLHAIETFIAEQQKSLTINLGLVILDEHHHVIEFIATLPL